MAAILSNAKELCAKSGAENDDDLQIKEELRSIVWFLTPKQAAMYIQVRFIVFLLNIIQN